MFGSARASTANGCGLLLAADEPHDIMGGRDRIAVAADATLCLTALRAQLFGIAGPRAFRAVPRYWCRGSP
jgi:hypothetical protein